MFHGAIFAHKQSVDDGEGLGWALDVNEPLDFIGLGVVAPRLFAAAIFLPGQGQEGARGPGPLDQQFDGAGLDRLGGSSIPCLPETLLPLWDGTAPPRSRRR